MLSPSLLPLLGLVASACSSNPTAPTPPAAAKVAAAQPAPSPVPVQPAPVQLAPVTPGELVVTSGSIRPAPGLEPSGAGPPAFAIREPTLRAWLGRTPRSAVEMEFVYRGVTARAAPLASGQLRRQIGVELRAQDSCNVVYVMWHVEPARGIVVSLKNNPGQSRHAECGDRGYTVLAPEQAHPVPPVRVGERHRLAATVSERELVVSVDNVRTWVGRLPPAAFAFDGPVGIRSDNGQFDVRLWARRAALQ
ncbi:MAG TPA: hypothetical protein VJU61_04665 [Polyangiaceae bacterium]|nr:hypothetical protein [Polyangiaceae bacterium]